MLQLRLLCLLLLSMAALSVAGDVPIYKGCGRTIRNVPEGIIDYPGKEEDYPSRARCRWHIFLDVGDRMEVSFQRFVTFHALDKLVAKNGQTGSKIGVFHGDSLPPDFETEENKLYLYFTSNTKSNGKGFQLTWKVIKGAMGIKIHNLEVQLQSMKDNQDIVMNNLTDVNSKLDYLIEHLDHPSTNPTPNPHPKPTPSPSTDHPSTYHPSTNPPPNAHPKPTPPPSTTSTPICTCGLPNYPHRIFNGQPVKPYTYPWHVGIGEVLHFYKYYCGGTIINSMFVLTASHCVYGTRANEIFVGIGDHDQTDTDDDMFLTQYIRVANINMHQLYNDLTTDYDFALLKLSEQIQFNNGFGIRPICLPEDDQSTYENEMSKILGWGWDETFSQPNILQEVDVAVLAPDCNHVYPSHQITSAMLCAASPGKDACTGDSGGSLAVLEYGRYVLVGMTSWGEDCADLVYPGVYSRVTVALDWIKRNAKEGDWCM